MTYKAAAELIRAEIKKEVTALDDVVITSDSDIIPGLKFKDAIVALLIPEEIEPTQQRFSGYIEKYFNIEILTLLKVGKSVYDRIVKTGNTDSIWSLTESVQASVRFNTFDDSVDYFYSSGVGETYPYEIPNSIVIGTRFMFTCTIREKE